MNGTHWWEGYNKEYRYGNQETSRKTREKRISANNNLMRSTIQAADRGSVTLQLGHSQLLEVYGCGKCSSFVT